MAKTKRPKRLYFDIETEPFSETFRVASDIRTRQQLVPKMRVACVFDGIEWRYFLPEEAPALIKLLSEADELISFNGPGYDELVLRRHYDLTGKLPLVGRHIDLCAEALSSVGYGVSLHKLSKLNLGEGKHTKGRAMASLDIEELKEACRSDVWQTYRLWQLWSEGTLKYPPPRVRKEHENGIGEYMPDLCPACHAVNTLEFAEVGIDEQEEMTDGQMSEYTAGTWGYAVCHACREVIHWELTPP